MNNENAQAIQKMADKLGVTPDNVWHALTKQAFYVACLDIFYILVLIGLAIFFYLGFRTVARRANELPKEAGRKKDTLQQDSGALALISFILWFLVAMLLLFKGPEMISGFFNPHYWALNQILTTYK